jgi:hypothetical protein
MEPQSSCVGAPYSFFKQNAAGPTSFSTPCSCMCHCALHSSDVFMVCFENRDDTSIALELHIISSKFFFRESGPGDSRYFYCVGSQRFAHGCWRMPGRSDVFQRFEFMLEIGSNSWHPMQNQILAIN